MRLKIIVIARLHPQCGTADAEINVPSVDDPELTNYFPLKPGAGKIINHAEEEEEKKKREKKREVTLLIALPINAGSCVACPRNKLQNT